MIQLSLTLEEFQTIMEALYDANSLPGTPTEGAAALYERLTDRFAEQCFGKDGHD